MTQLTKFAGGCHCGNLRYVFSTDQAPPDWPVRRCTCSYCVRLGARYTSGPGTSLDITAKNEATVERYEFGTRTAEFFRCRNCGVMILASSQIEDVRYAVLNVNTLDNKESLALNSVDTDFEGEQTDNRLARRQKNWIADVRIRFLD